MIRLHLEINETAEEKPKGNEVQSQEQNETIESGTTSLMKEGAMSLMVSKFIQCGTQCMNIGTAEEWFGKQRAKEEKRVTVTFEIAGGVDLTIPSSTKKTRRIPSDENLDVLFGKAKIEPPPRLQSDASVTSFSSLSKETPLDEHHLRLLKRQKRAREVFGERSVLSFPSKTSLS